MSSLAERHPVQHLAQLRADIRQRMGEVRLASISGYLVTERYRASLSLGVSLRARHSSSTEALQASHLRLIWRVCRTTNGNA